MACGDSAGGGDAAGGDDAQRFLASAPPIPPAPPPMPPATPPAPPFPPAGTFQPMVNLLWASGRYIGRPTDQKVCTLNHTLLDTKSLWEPGYTKWEHDKPACALVGNSGTLFSANYGAFRRARGLESVHPKAPHS
eukprot:2648725-Pyramimonas_sp.AAC.2